VLPIKDAVVEEWKERIAMNEVNYLLLSSGLGQDLPAHFVAPGSPPHSIQELTVWLDSKKPESMVQLLQLIKQA
jgi:hypothetical protein